MGTRGAVGYRVDSVDKISYVHWDSYPTGLGANVMKYVRETPIEKIKEIARSIVLVDENAKPTAEQIDECKKWADTRVSTGELDEWYVLLRGTQGNLSVYNEVKYMIDGHKFLLDSLFCEYAYIINLDSGMLEIYNGFNESPGKGRYAAHKVRDGYCGVSLYMECSLTSIQQMSVEDIEKFCEKVENEVENGEEEDEGIDASKTPYEILGVTETSSLKDITEAYHLKAKSCHPDKVASLSPVFTSVAEEQMKKLNVAYEELKKKFN